MPCRHCGEGNIVQAPDGCNTYACGYCPAEFTKDSVERPCKKGSPYPDVFTRIVPEVCTCDIRVAGCTCGVFKREQEIKKKGD